MTETTPFYVDRAKTGRANCKGCKTNCPEGELRLAKLVASPYGDNQQMKSWHHVSCFMNMLLKQRPTTKRIDSIDDIGNWSSLSKEDQESLLKEINDMEKLYADKHAGKYTAKVIKNLSCHTLDETASPKNTLISKTTVKINEDDMFLLFYDLCMKISKVDAYTEKTAVVNKFFRKGSKGDTFNGDLALWCKLLLPQVTKRIYNLKSKQLIKLFSRIFNTDQDDMLTHLEKGDVADTITHFYSKSKTYQPASDSTLTIHDVENFLEDLSKLTKEDEQTYHFKKIIKKCTLNDIKMIIRLIKGDLRINAGPKHILQGVHPDAYNVFQTSRDLNMVLDKVLTDSSGVQHKDATQKTVEAELILMTPVLPMLAEACKSVEMAMKKCPNGIFSEIKYDGERVQVHKKGNEFKYFSRALKPVMPHKVSHFKDYLPKAFPKGVDLVLDAEVLMVDVNTGKPLPFGTLGIHKQSKFKDAQVCLFVFDCLYYNGEILMGYPIKKRRKFLYENMVEVKNHIMFSEQKLIEQPSDLAKMIAEVLQLGLEGLVLKDIESIYEPGKRHWLKVKKDYLFDGAMADTADLVVLGAWFGTGKKGGMMSVFLMGCLDTHRDRWVTVTKVHTGHDDNALEKLQKELSPLMVKISQDSNKVPKWLDCNKGLVPDFVALDPKKQPVWEITGTEFTKANIHTADGISVRFPRVTRIRDDKDWKTATNLEELKNLFKTSKEKTDVSLLDKLATTVNDESPKKKTDSSHLKIRKMDSFLIKKENPLTGPSKKEDEKSLDITTEKNVDVEISPPNRKIIKEECIQTKGENKKRKHSSSTDSTNNKSPENKNKAKKDKKSIKSKREDKERNNFSSVDVTIETKAEVETSPLNKREMNENQKTSSKTQKTDRKRKRSSSSSSNSTIVMSPLDTKKIKKEKTPFKTKAAQKEHKKIRRLSSSSSDATIDTSIEGTTIPLNSNKNNPKKTKKISLSDYFESDSESDNEEKTKDIWNKFIADNPLPDVFLGKKLGFYPDFISFTEEERDYFERHWIAYGGTVVKSIRSTDVDYVVHTEGSIEFNKMQKLVSKLGPEVRHVNKNWLIKCISEVCLLDTKKYTVVVKASSS